MNDLVEELNYNDHLSDKFGGDAAERKDNVEQIIDAAGEFNDKENGVYSFLENVSLITNNDKENEEGKVTLLSLHSCKGLEFIITFICGCEQGIIPHQLAMQEDLESGIQEETRLMFVGISRAKRVLYLTYCRNRKRFGAFGNMTYKATKPSQFLKEAGLIEDK